LANSPDANAPPASEGFLSLARHRLRQPVLPVRNFPPTVKIWGFEPFQFTQFLAELGAMGPLERFSRKQQVIQMADLLLLRTRGRESRSILLQFLNSSSTSSGLLPIKNSPGISRNFIPMLFSQSTGTFKYAAHSS